MSPRVKKYLLFGVILLVGVALDQWTKWLAVERLANGRLQDSHTISLRVDEEDDGETLREYLGDEFSANRAEMLDRIASRWVYGPDGQRMSPSDTVGRGQILEVVHRPVEVVPGYFELEYAENRGAAFSFLSDSDSPYRLPFLIGVSILSIALIIYLLEGVAWGQTVLVLALSFVASGAIGNLIDRVRLGYVIDFVLWKYGEQFRWPNFNIADAFITVGVVIMLVGLFVYDEEME
jgi:signal peptidase II